MPLSTPPPLPSDDPNPQPTGNDQPTLPDLTRADVVATLYLVTLQIALYRHTGHPNRETADAQARVIANYIASRPQPLSAYQAEAMPSDRCALFGVQLVPAIPTSDRYALCTLTRGRWGRLRTDKVLSTHPTLQGAQAALEARCDVIVTLKLVDGVTPPHWVAYARCDLYPRIYDPSESPQDDSS